LIFDIDLFVRSRYLVGWLGTMDEDAMIAEAEAEWMEQQDDMMVPVMLNDPVFSLII